MLVDKTNFGLVLYNHDNFCRFEESSSYWSVKRISVFLCFSLVNQRHTSGITVYNRPVTSIENTQSGEPGLVDRVLTLHSGSRGFDSHRGHMSERFFRSSRPGYPHPVSSELEIVVSEWRSVIAVSLNFDGGVRLIRPAKLAKHYKHNTDGRTAPGVCGNGSVPLSHSGNVVTRI